MEENRIFQGKQAYEKVEKYIDRDRMNKAQLIFVIV